MGSVKKIIRSNYNRKDNSYFSLLGNPVEQKFLMAYFLRKEAYYKHK